MRLRLLALGLLFLLGCPDDETGSDGSIDSGPLEVGLDADAADAADAADSGPAPDAGLDASSDTGVDEDATVAQDVDPMDLGPRDLGVDTGTISDAGTPDAGTGDGGPADVGCEYIDLDVFIVKCGAGYEYARRFVDVNGQCAEYFELLGLTGATLSAVITDAECDPTCEYRAETSVSFLDPCGRRNGYIIFGTGDDVTCPPLYEFSDGLFPSVEAWEMSLNCGG